MDDMLETCVFMVLRCVLLVAVAMGYSAVAKTGLGPKPQISTLDITLNPQLPQQFDRSVRPIRTVSKLAVAGLALVAHTHDKHLNDRTARSLEVYAYQPILNPHIRRQHAAPGIH